VKVQEDLLTVEWPEVSLAVYREVCLMRARADNQDDRRIPRVLTRKVQRLPRLPHGDHKELCINLRLSRTCAREQSNENGGRAVNGGKLRGKFGGASRDLSDGGKGWPSRWSSDNKGPYAQGSATASAVLWETRSQY
jgi:hypothetical protein